jgi:AcrR family transcriptional regulator
MRGSIEAPLRTAYDEGMTIQRASAPRAKRPVGATKRQRMLPQDRERLIVAGAVKYFAEHGFGGDTRSLARELGVTQSLLFRYFPNKDALIERLYQEIWLSRWDPKWEVQIADRTLPLKRRLIAFFIDYAHATLQREWIRIFFFAGLRGSKITQQLMATLRERVVLAICRELRTEFGLPSEEAVPISDFEVELVFGIIGRLVYFGVRRWIYETPVPEDLDPHIESMVEVFFEGVEKTLLRRLSQQVISGREAAAPAT